MDYCFDKFNELTEKCAANEYIYVVGHIGLPAAQGRQKVYEKIQKCMSSELFSLFGNKVDGRYNIRK